MFIGWALVQLFEMYASFFSGLDSRAAPLTHFKIVSFGWLIWMDVHCNNMVNRYAAAQTLWDEYLNLKIICT